MTQLMISIVTWNSADSIESCIKSVLNQTYTNFVLHVLDNASTDQTRQIVRSFKDDRLKFHESESNTGFCGGHNYNLVNSKSEYVLLVNPDIEMQLDYVDQALKIMKADNRVGTLCGLLLQESLTAPDGRIDSAGLDLKRSRVMRMRHHEERRNEVALADVEVFGADGALPLYRRSMIDDIAFEGRFFDDMFFAHKEDWDVSWRASLYGWKTKFSPSCIALHPRHFKPKSVKLRTGVDPRIKVHSVKNQLILMLKNESMSSFLLNAVFIIPRQIAILVFILLFERPSLEAYRYVWRNRSEILRKRKVIQKRASKRI